MEEVTVVVWLVGAQRLWLTTQRRETDMPPPAVTTHICPCCAARTWCTMKAAAAAGVM